MSQYDVVVIGGGAAGLSAALVLARARRRVLVVDAGTPRNAPAAHMQGFLSRDGLPPGDLLALGRAEDAPAASTAGPYHPWAHPVTAVQAGDAAPRLRPLTPVPGARMVPDATSHREVRTQRGRSTGTPAFAGIGTSRWAERSS